MTETREIRLDVTEEEKNLLWQGLEELAYGPASTIVALKNQITRAWIEREVELDPNVVVRCADGRNVVVRSKYSYVRRKGEEIRS